VPLIAPDNVSEALTRLLKGVTPEAMLDPRISAIERYMQEQGRPSKMPIQDPTRSGPPFEGDPRYDVQTSEGTKPPSAIDLQEQRMIDEGIDYDDFLDTALRMRRMR
jgi:hypothetical protein